ncbi:hypothetical protein COU60_05005 [Candidatus Pacearchaeota archaeon CG10_big_fil_rev_8_21_14_0_10_34_76]|nr:MAG: hypothetical protein COU60_05005 [Candidatus Pacearchaeota archaeon CG10_big_fil_rev_8_21_14_0_10_34_76]
MERVTTGGMIRFEYPKGHNPKLSIEEKREFDEAWKKAKERIKKEKRNKIIIGSIIALIIIIIGLIYYF